MGKTPKQKAYAEEGRYVMMELALAGVPLKRHRHGPHLASLAFENLEHTCALTISHDGHKWWAQTVISRKGVHSLWHKSVYENFKSFDVDELRDFVMKWYETHKK